MSIAGISLRSRIGVAATGCALAASVVTVGGTAAASTVYPLVQRRSRNGVVVTGALGVGRPRFQQDPAPHEYPVGAVALRGVQSALVPSPCMTQRTCRPCARTPRTPVASPPTSTGTSATRG